MNPASRARRAILRALLRWRWSRAEAGGVLYSPIAVCLSVARGSNRLPLRPLATYGVASTASTRVSHHGQRSRSPFSRQPRKLPGKPSGCDEGIQDAHCPNDAIVHEILRRKNGNEWSGTPRTPRCPHPTTTTGRARRRGEQGKQPFGGIEDREPRQEIVCFAQRFGSVQEGRTLLPRKKTATNSTTA